MGLLCSLVLLPAVCMCGLTWISFSFACLSLCCLSMSLCSSTCSRRAALLSITASFRLCCLSSSWRILSCLLSSHCCAYCLSASLSRALLSLLSSICCSTTSAQCRAKKRESMVRRSSQRSFHCLL